MPVELLDDDKYKLFDAKAFVHDASKYEWDLGPAIAGTSGAGRGGQPVKRAKIEQQNLTSCRC